MSHQHRLITSQNSTSIHRHCGAAFRNSAPQRLLLLTNSITGKASTKVSAVSCFKRRHPTTAPTTTDDQRRPLGIGEWHLGLHRGHPACSYSTTLLTMHVLLARVVRIVSFTSNKLLVASSQSYPIRLPTSPLTYSPLSAQSPLRRRPNRIVALNPIATTHYGVRHPVVAAQRGHQC